MVQGAVQAGIPSSQLTLDRLQASARRVLGQELAFDEAVFEEALDPAHFVAVRTGAGGVAAVATAAVLDTLDYGLEQDRHELDAIHARRDAAAAMPRAAIEKCNRRDSGMEFYPASPGSHRHTGPATAGTRPSAGESSQR